MTTPELKNQQQTAEPIPITSPAAVVEAPIPGLTVPTPPSGVEIPTPPSGVEIPTPPSGVEIPTPPSGVEIPTPPSEVAVLRRQLAQAEAERQAQIAETTLIEEARVVQRNALARGLSDDDALWVAQNHYTVAKRVSQQQSQLREQQAYLQDKQEYAARVAKQYGVDAELLMIGNTPQDMVAMAVREKRYKDLEADIKALKQGRVPAQEFNRSGSSPASNITVTSENIDKLWMDYEIAHPGNSNPYDAAYRRLVRG